MPPLTGFQWSSIAVFAAVLVGCIMSNVRAARAARRSAADAPALNQARHNRHLWIEDTVGAIQAERATRVRPVISGPIPARRKSDAPLTCALCKESVTMQTRRGSVAVVERWGQGEVLRSTREVWCASCERSLLHPIAPVGG